jgi:hypothetical protein
MNRETRKKSTRYVAICAVLAALGVVLLAVGALFQVLDLTMAVVASLLVILAVIELGGYYPHLLYLVTALLSLLLVPVKTAPLAYACFCGFYPILKGVYERKLSPLLAWVCKLLTFNSALALLLLLSVRLFALFSLEPWMYWCLPLLTPVFCLYDVALTRVISMYVNRWRAHFRFLHK